jgi:hypothetical protein
VTIPLAVIRLIFALVLRQRMFVIVRSGAEVVAEKLMQLRLIAFGVMNIRKLTL